LIQNVAKVETEPDNEEAVFSLIASLVDEPLLQLVIIMRDDNVRIAYRESEYSQYYYGTERGFASGMFDPVGFVKRLQGTNLVNINANGPVIELSSSGKRFADWLLAKGKKAKFMSSPLGNWGTPEDPPFQLREEFWAHANRKKPKGQGETSQSSEPNTP
jgi:hypothetical protein